MEPKRSTRSIWITVVVVAVVVAAGFTWRLLSERSQPPVPPPPVAQAAAPSQAPAPSMPPTPAADASVLGAASALSSSAKFKEWLGAGDLARRFVATVNQVADGASPRAVLPFLAPNGRFETEQEAGKTFIDPKSYARYDEEATVISSIDAKAAANAYAAIHSLLATAYSEIGKPGTTLDARLEEAIQRLVTTPELPERTEVAAAPVGTAYRFADARLEQLSPASKHLLRMGPGNEKLIQAKLRELDAELHLAAGGTQAPEGSKGN